MTPHPYLLAAALIIAEPDAPLTVPITDQTIADVRDLAIHLELLDPREIRYTFFRACDFEADLNIVRRRRVHIGNAPPVSDVQRFPPKDQINELLTFNRTYRNYADCWRFAAGPRQDFFAEAVTETDRLYCIWDALRDAQCEYYYVTVRRAALLKVREEIGPADYYAGRLPPWVPVWRFSR